MKIEKNVQLDWISFNAFLALLVIVIGVLAGAVQASSYFSGEAYDGAFQAFNALRRFKENGMLGRDFQVFHGVGTTLIHYPIFILFGGTLAASELARWLVSPLLFTATTFVLFASVGLPKKHAWLISMFAVLLLTQFFGVDLFFPGYSLLGVRTSGPFLLAAAWLWLLRIYQPTVSSKKYLLVECLVLGIGNALALFVATEVGMVCTAVTFLTLLIFPPISRSLRMRVVSIFGVFVVTAVLYTILCVAVAGIFFGDVIRFYFQMIPRDQFWYFGVYPNKFFRNWSDVIQSDTLELPLLLGLLTFGIFILWRKSEAADQQIKIVTSAWLFLILATASLLISNLGYVSVHYGEPILRTCLLAIFVRTYFAISTQTVAMRICTKMFSGSFGGMLILSGMGIASYGFVNSLKLTMQYEMVPPHQFNDRDITQIREGAAGLSINRRVGGGMSLSPVWAATLEAVSSCIGYPSQEIALEDINNDTIRNGIGILPYRPVIAVTDEESIRSFVPGDIVQFADGTQRMIQLIRGIMVYLSYGQLDAEANAGKTVRFIAQGKTKRIFSGSFWTTYAGLIDNYYGRIPPATDYIIHSLGEAARLKYSEKFNAAKTDYVLTLRRKHFPYEEWLQTTSWEFYQQLISNYKIVGTSPLYHMWKRGNGSDSTIRGEKFSVEVNRPSRIEIEDVRPELPWILLDAEIQYDITNPFNWLPIFSKIPRYFVKLNGASNRHPVSLPPFLTRWSFPIFIKNKSTLLIEPSIQSLLPAQELRVKSISLEPMQVSPLTIQAMLDSRGTVYPDCTDEG